MVFILTSREPSGNRIDLPALTLAEPTQYWTPSCTTPQEPTIYNNIKNVDRPLHVSLSLLTPLEHELVSPQTCPMQVCSFLVIYWSHVF